MAGIGRRQVSTTARQHPRSHAELLSVMDGLERHFGDMCDIEFTIEKGNLYILQTRAGKRTATAAVRIAVDLTAEGIIDRRTAVTRVDPSSLEQFDRPRIDLTVAAQPVAKGLAASPGAAFGQAVFLADRAATLGNANDP